MCASWRLNRYARSPPRCLPFFPFCPLPGTVLSCVEFGERRITPDLKSETTAKTASGREGANLDKFFVVLVEVKLFVRRIFHTTAMVELFEPLLSCP